MAERVFVTGAGGRLGRPLCAALVDLGLEVRGLVRSEADAAALSVLGAVPVRGALEDPAALARGLDGVERVFHLAGGPRRPGVRRRNVGGVLRLLAALRGRPLRRLVLASSAAVYGDRAGGRVTEASPPRPHTAYGRAKLAAEQAALASGLPVVIARLGPVVGPGFPVSLAGPIARGWAVLPGDGRALVPAILAPDAVAALVHLGDAALSGPLVNVAAPAPVSLRALYEAVARAVGGRPPRYLGPAPWLPDPLRLLTASVRVDPSILASTGFVWRYPDPLAGVPAVWVA